MPKYRRYTPEQKAEIIGLVLNGTHTCQQAARLHGIPQTNVFRWVVEVTGKNRPPRWRRRAALLSPKWTS